MSAGVVSEDLRCRWRIWGKPKSSFRGLTALVPYGQRIRSGWAEPALKTMRKNGCMPEMAGDNPIMLTCKKAQASQSPFVTFSAPHQKAEDPPVPDGTVATFFDAVTDEFNQSRRR